MPLYTILATKEVYYEFVIEADDEPQALDEFNSIELSGDIDKYEIDSYPLEITDIEVEEELA